MSDSDKSFFNNLSDFGLNNLNNISIYDSGQANAKKDTVKEKQVSPVDFVFDRKVECPVCYKQITVKAVKSSSVRILSKETDFMVRYQEPNPLFYDCWLCTHCGYAAISNRFNILTDKQKKLIRENISSRWNFKKVYPPLYTADIAIEMHQLALLSTIVKVGRDSEKGILCLKLGWLHRIKEDKQNELKFLGQAIQGLCNAYEKENQPVPGMDEASLQYLIGELFRRIGDTSSAMQWFSRVLSNRTAKPKTKDMARDQKDLIFKLQGENKVSTGAV